MAAIAVEIHPDAVLEARAAYLWYQERSHALALAFLAELESAIAHITSAPDRWAKYVGDTRSYRLRRFPFSVVYLSRIDGILVLAVAHGRRRPGYWKTRSGPLGP